MATAAAAAADGAAKKSITKKGSSLAAAGAEIVTQPKLKLKEKDDLQKKVFHS